MPYMQGYTALDTLIENLSTKEESGQGYDLEEEHTAICELLRKEMKRRGYDPPSPNSVATPSVRRRTAADRRRDSSRPSQRTKTHKEVYIQCSPRCTIGTTTFDSHFL